MISACVIVWCVQSGYIGSPAPSRAVIIRLSGLIITIENYNIYIFHSRSFLAILAHTITGINVLFLLRYLKKMLEDKAPSH